MSKAEWERKIINSPRAGKFIEGDASRPATLETIIRPIS